ncbi:proline--tRNA ligase [bacterium]|nr:MAG: proline--tRNA ligase [bacterium]
MAEERAVQEYGEETLVKEIPPKAADLSKWYTAACWKAELFDYTPVRGSIALRPYGYALWENLQRQLDDRFKATGHMNAYFPLFIPESLLMREADHVEGFAPEVAWVTQGGSEKLTERLAVRPTSEVIIGVMYARWVKSYRDLPVLINCWNNVVRWEKATRPFLRTMEFLWQEGHTAHASHEESAAEVARMLEVYREVAEDVCALPVVTGEKSASERFAGALHTHSIEALMPDGKALQAATSHDLGQNFARAYGIEFVDKDQQTKHAWTTSWGLSWRMLGGLIMMHGDDRGLRLPPVLAPYQVVIVPIPKKGSEEAIAALARQVRERLAKAGVRVRLDDRDEHKPGWKFSEWELRGVPLRLEIGARDVESGRVTAVRRDLGKGEDGAKTELAVAQLELGVHALLDAIQQGLHAQARAFLDAHRFDVSSREEFFDLLRRQVGFVRIPFCDDPACEAEIKSETSATTRNQVPLAQGEALTCVACGGPAQTLAYFARSY